MRPPVERLGGERPHCLGPRPSPLGPVGGDGGEGRVAGREGREGGGINWGWDKEILDKGLPFHTKHTTSSNKVAAEVD